MSFLSIIDLFTKIYRTSN